MTALFGKRVLITGASSGIGAATALLFATQGARLALVARTPEPLQRFAARLDQWSYPADVTDPNEVSAAVAAAHTELGGLDIVVQCAGMVVPANLANTTGDLWQRTIETNLSGTFYVAKEAAARMKRGVIINMGSDAAAHGVPLYVAYCAAKGGVVALTKALARELAPRIRVNVVCPGPIDTRMLAGEFATHPDPDAVRSETLSAIPLWRFGTADEVAAAVLYLATAENITGAVIPIDGGITS